MSQSVDEDSVPVKTTVPRSQKETWAADADSLNMSQSEFIRTMVQAGRAGLEAMTLEAPPEGSHPRGNVLERYLLETLSDPSPFGELVSECESDLEALIEEQLELLEEQGKIEYTPRGPVRKSE